MSTYKLICPACLGPLRVRTSRGKHICFKPTLYQCQNLACGATFSGHHEITHQLSPSALERPHISLPLASLAIRRAAQQLNQSEIDKQQMDLLEHHP